jgi:CO/xanthine dehydrogenase Mo-binding subunit
VDAWEKVRGRLIYAKEDVTVECLLGLLVWTTRRPVRLVFSREESFIGHGKRHPYVLRYRTGATRSGELLARSDSPRSRCVEQQDHVG